MASIGQFLLNSLVFPITFKLVRRSKSVPVLLNKPAHWHLRAQEAHLLASHLEDPEAKAATLKIAAEYERLALRAAQRLKEQDKPETIVGLPVGGDVSRRSGAADR
jgi:hypothetical protein